MFKQKYMRYFLLLLTLGMAGNIRAQENPDARTPTPVRDTREWYLQKSHNQKTWAWVLLGGGVLVGGISLATSVSDFESGNANSQKLSAGEVLVFVGGGMVVASVPLFIASSRNKRMAAQLEVKKETSFTATGPGGRAFPALGLRFGF
jgi:hypothetical protein